MFGSEVLEVAIGLATMFFILATAASAIAETLSRMLQKRAKDLEANIREMFTARAPDHPPGDPAGQLTRSQREDERAARLQGADGFMDELKKTSVWQSAEAAAGRTLFLKRKVGNSYLSAKAFADAIQEALASPSAQSLLDRVPNLRKRIETLEADAKRGVLDIKAGLESWFDETMGRAEGAYKRWAVLVLFVVGLVFAVLGNASTIDVARELWQDPATRAAVSESAANLTVDGNPNPALDANEDGIVSVAEATDKLGELSLPVGWDLTGADDVGTGDDVVTHANNGLVDFIKNAEPDQFAFTFLGWLLTALLVMLGGPFWFDILSRLVALRGAGTKPPKAEEDKGSATQIVAAVLAPAAGGSGGVVVPYDDDPGVFGDALEVARAADEQRASQAADHPAAGESAVTEPGTEQGGAEGDTRT